MSSDDEMRYPNVINECVKKAESLVPIITDKDPAPLELLVDIRCHCVSSTRFCATCSCAMEVIACSIHCKCVGNCRNRSDFEIVNLIDR